MLPDVQVWAVSMDQELNPQPYHSKTCAVGARICHDHVIADQYGRDMNGFQVNSVHT